ncbi:MAG: hypothetical protein PHQ40_17645 [Anaerolineaceae bacterium]|nr:hypothetical protein [Anaerolineaceae bacterium]
MLENGKPKFAMYWAAACGGCEIAVLNTNEGILDVDANFEVVFWPAAMDAKYHDLEAMEDGAITLCLFNGGIRNDENEAVARLLRRKSKILVAFGACACEGGIPGLANQFATQEILDTAFHTNSTDNPEGLYPSERYRVNGGEINLPHLYHSLKTLNLVAEVDYYLPGCPPESRQIMAVIRLVIQALHGQAVLPPKGAVIGAGASTVCDECPRLRGEKTIHEFKRMATFQPNPLDCLLEQGILCSGIATRSGCEARCPEANMPCIGCYGPAQGVLDQGARMMSAVASVTAGKTPGEVDGVLDGIVDPVGTFYRFSLANSILHRGKPAEERRD